jgi:Fe2+ or Zn2+ uptake regulation protein
MDMTKIMTSAIGTTYNSNGYYLKGLMRYSKQREEVMRVMRSGSLDHPTAQQVHDLVRSSMPEVSLGTVYRNLHQLVDAGELVEVCVGGAVHYDTHLDSHHHIVCTRCGMLIDLPVDQQLESEMKAKATELGHHVEQFELHIKGQCAQCRTTQFNS